MFLGGGVEDVDKEVPDNLGCGFTLGAALDQFLHFRAEFRAELFGIEAEEQAAKLHGVRTRWPLRSEEFRPCVRLRRERCVCREW